MSKSIWSDNLKIGHPRIDDDHEAMIALAEDVDRLIVGRGGLNDIHDRIQRFHVLLVTHCAFEERLMALLPQAAYGTRVTAHCQGHAKLIAMVAEMVRGVFDLGHAKLADLNVVVLDLMNDLLCDDTLLIRDLMIEGLHHLHAAAAPPDPAE